MLIKLDIPMSFLTNNDCNTTKKVVKCKWITNEQARWQNRVQREPKFNFYRIFDFRCLRLADCINLRSTCSFLSNLNGGTLPLREETARFANESREERWWRVCDDQNEIEDTIHFLASCPAL